MNGDSNDGIPDQRPQWLSQPSSLTRQKSWYNLTSNEVEKQLEDLGKPLFGMNLDELLKNVWTAEASQSTGTNIAQSTSLQRQASLTLARALSGKTVDQVWNEIQQGQKRKNSDDNDVKYQERESSFGEVTLEDFLVQAGLFAEASIGLSMEPDPIDPMTPQIFTQQSSLSPSLSITVFSSSASLSGKRDRDAIEKCIERKLRRKVKNRGSAACSRARKQAYHNELVNKVSRFEETNIRLRKEKEFDNTLPFEESSKPKFQLWRMSSSSF